MESVDGVVSLISNFGLPLVITAVVMSTAYWYLIKEYPARLTENRERHKQLDEQMKAIIEQVALSRMALEASNTIIQKSISDNNVLVNEQKQLVSVIEKHTELLEEHDKSTEKFFAVVESMINKIRVS